MDEENHKYPVGPLQLKKFANPKNDDYGKTDYYRDPNALKLISQTEWSSDRPLYDIKDPHQPIALERIDWLVRAQRTRNWIRCASQSNHLSRRTVHLHPNPKQAHGAARLRLVHHDLGLVHPHRAARERQARHRRDLGPQHPRLGQRAGATH